jgi:flagellin
MSDITLSAGVRQNLLSLQNTASLLTTTQEHLATGKKVNSALDNPTSLFTSQSLNNRANSLNSLLDQIGNATQTLQAANQGLTSLTSLLQQALATVHQALQAPAPSTLSFGVNELGLTASTVQGTAVASGNNATRATLQGDFNALLTKIDQLAGDASFNGVNLLNGDNLQVVFNETNTSSLNIQGVTFNSTGLGLLQISGTGFQNNATINTTISSLNTALSAVQSQTETFGTNASTIQIRQSFTQQLVNVLQTGASNLVLVDQNQESANLLTLQTQQQLEISALSIANRANQSVLKLFP